MAELPTLVELVVAVNDRLTGAGVGHGFGGALALAYYVAEPRATRDMDVNVSVPVEEASRVFALLPPSISWTAADVDRCIRDGQVRLWQGPSREGIAVDLFFPQHRFHRAVAAATSLRPFARPDYFLPVIAAAHLAVFKVLFDRPQDWVDIAAMLRVGTVDEDETRHWLEVLLGASHPNTSRFVELAAQKPRGDEAGTGHGGPMPVIDWGSFGEPS